MISLLLHVSGQEPVKVDVDEMPDPKDMVIIGRNPRERSDKEVIFIEDGVTVVIFPWWRINYVQVLPSTEDELLFPLPFRD